MTDGFGGSDHQSFYAKEIPVLFAFMGVHAGITTGPAMIPEPEINYGGMARIADYLEPDPARRRSDRPEPPRIGEPRSPNSHDGRMPVTRRAKSKASIRREVVRRLTRWERCPRTMEYKAGGLQAVRSARRRTRRESRTQGRRHHHRLWRQGDRHDLRLHGKYEPIQASATRSRSWSSGLTRKSKLKVTARGSVGQLIGTVNATPIPSGRLWDQ